MGACLLAAAAVTGVAGYPGSIPAGPLSVEVVLYHGDPFGRGEGRMIEPLRASTVVTQSGRLALFRLGGHDIDVLPTAFPRGRIHLEVGARPRTPDRPGSGGPAPGCGEPCGRQSRLAAAGQPLTVYLDTGMTLRQHWVVIRTRPAKP